MTTLEKILNLIQQSGKSEYQIKKETGLKNSIFSEWKAGRAKPSVPALITLADYFNVSVDYLLGRETSHPSTTPNPSTAKIVEKMAERGITRERLARLDEKQTEDLLNIIEIFLKNIK